MQLILSITIVIIFISSALVVIRWGNLRCKGKISTSTPVFLAILFTSSLDVGLIMLPMTEFPVYRDDSTYNFTNPLAVEFGFWGFLVWVMYFLTTFYFCIVEPKLKLFEIPFIKLINNIVIITTCAFTGFLLFKYLPSYIEGISDAVRYPLVGFVVLLSVVSSTRLSYLKVLSIASLALFFVLVIVMGKLSGIDQEGMLSMLFALSSYFENIHRFVTPISTYHQFYLFWWLAWSIMIGQFVSRFVGGMKTWQLLVTIIIVPSIPIAGWFSILYYYQSNSIEISSTIKMAMVFVGILFVINSLDSLIRLYTLNLNLTVKRLGRTKYVIGNWLVLSLLILSYQFTPLKMEWVGLIVIAIYLAVYILIFKRRKTLEI